MRNTFDRVRGINELNRIGVIRLSTSVTSEIGANTFFLGSRLRYFLAQLGLEAGGTHSLRANRRVHLLYLSHKVY